MQYSKLFSLIPGEQVEGQLGARQFPTEWLEE
jgi:hypothetical protein